MVLEALWQVSSLHRPLLNKVLTPTEEGGGWDESWGHLRDVHAARAADSLGGAILTSGPCVDADVTAALSTQDTVNELFPAQMRCFLTIWCTVKCMVFQAGMVW